MNYNIPIVITGPGRSGTTMMVELFREMGYTTGDCSPYDDRIRAGYELNVDITAVKLNRVPQVVKSPRYMFNLKGLIDSNVIVPSRVILCVRNLRHCAISRIENNIPDSVHREQCGHDVVLDVNKYEQSMMKTIGKFIVDMAARNIFIITIDYRNAIHNSSYLWLSLRSVIFNKDTMSSYEDFKRVYGKVVKPEYESIGSYSNIVRASDS